VPDAIGSDRTHVVVDCSVDAPAQRLWEVLVAWERQGEWMLGTSVHTSQGDGASVGSELTAVTGRPPLAFTDTMRITEWDPPRRCVVEHTGHLVRGDGVFEVVAVTRTRSRIVWTERLELPFGAIGRIGWVVVGPISRLGLLWSLRRLARVAERSR
jgi:uncharacterized protein YndB with AHSA1/START domain